MVVCFYSSSNPASYKTLHAFERSVLYFKNEVKKANSVKLRFGLVDLAEAENAKSELTSFFTSFFIKNIHDNLTYVLIALEVLKDKYDLWFQNKCEINSSVQVKDASFESITCFGKKN